MRHEQMNRPSKRHAAAEMTYVGRARRQARNGKGYWVVVHRCPVCDRATHALANLSRGRRVAPCEGR